MNLALLEGPYLCLIGYSPSQSVLAKETDADPKGSYVYLIERSLNKYVAGKPYKW
jgi:hypothetical protein